MTMQSYESRLVPLIERLDSAWRAVDDLVGAKSDGELVRRLKDGTYDVGDLDRLFALVEQPLRASLVYLAGNNRRDRGIERCFDPVEDAFLRVVVQLSLLHHRMETPPTTDLLEESPDDKRLGRRGAIQVGLVRRLVAMDGLESLDEMIDRAKENHFAPLPRIDERDLERLVNLMAPVECQADMPMLLFRDKAGHSGSSGLRPNGEWVASFVDKSGHRWTYPDRPTR